MQGDRKKIRFPVVIQRYSVCSGLFDVGQRRISDDDHEGVARQSLEVPCDHQAGMGTGGDRWELKASLMAQVCARQGDA